MLNPSLHRTCAKCCAGPVNSNVKRPLSKRLIVRNESKTAASAGCLPMMNGGRKIRVGTLSGKQAGYLKLADHVHGKVRTMRIRLWGLVWATLILGMSSARSASLCAENEAVLFSCGAKNRTISLCGTKGSDGAAGGMQYRFGKPGKIEFAYPEANKRPDKAFSRHFVSWGNGSAEWVVSFSRGKYTYSVYADLVFGSPDAMNEDRSGEYGYHAGVRVTSNGKLLRDTRCVSDDPAQFDPWALNETFSPLLPEAASDGTAE